MNKNTFTTLALGAAILASCTLEKDAQHGISFEFQHPNQRSKSEVRDQPERIASTTTSVSSPAAATTDWVAAPATTYAAAPSEFWTTPAESYDEPTYAEPTAIADEAPAAVEPSIDATEEVAEETVVVAQKKSWAQRLVEFMAPDNEMVIAALLAFFLGGFGAHWFYLGERGRGMARLLVTLGGLLLYIIGAVMYVAAGGASILGAAIAFIALLALFANQILVIIDLVNILTDNW
jgi:TM2 domain-containing membrane protein YozV